MPFPPETDRTGAVSRLHPDHPETQKRTDHELHKPDKLIS